MTNRSHTTTDDTIFISNGSSEEVKFSSFDYKDSGLGFLYTGTGSTMQFIDTVGGIKIERDSSVSSYTHADANGFGRSTDFFQSLQVTLPNGSSTTHGSDQSYYDNVYNGIESKGANFSSFFSQINPSGTSWGTNQNFGTWSSGPVGAINMPANGPGIDLMPEFGTPLMMDQGISMPHGPASMSSPPGLPFAGASVTNDMHPPVMAFAYNNAGCSIE